MTVKLIGNSIAGNYQSGNYVLYDYFVAIASGLLSEIRLYTGAVTGAAKVAIYSNDSGHPSALLASGSGNCSATNDWNTITLDAPITITSGIAYWLGTCTDANDVVQQYKVDSTWPTTVYDMHYKAVTFGTFTFPETFDHTDFLSVASRMTTTTGWGTSAAKTKTYTADALFKKLGLTKILDADTLLKKLGILQTVDVDALLQKGFTRTFLAKAIFGAANISELTADALFKALGLTQTLDVDALLQQQDITQTVDVDAILKLIATQSIDADALLRAALSQTVDVDALFQKLGLTQDVDVDALFLKSVTEAILADLLLQKGLTQAVDVDALLRGALTKTFTADVRLGEMGIEVFTASVYFKRLAYHVILDAQYITETPEVNRAYVIGRDAESNPVHGTDLEQSEIDLVGERLDFTLALSIPTSSLAADVADAILKKQRLSKHRGFITIPPNAGAELWDVIQVRDELCAQSSSKYRIVAISFDYQPRQRRYQHKLFLAAR